MCDILAACVNEHHTDWEDDLPLAVLAHRTPNKSTDADVEESTGVTLSLQYMEERPLDLTSKGVVNHASYHLTLPYHF